VPQIQVSLPAGLTNEQLAVVLDYFESSGRLTARQWRTALETFDRLAQADVALGVRRLTFRQVYDRYVDRRFADGFIAQLLKLDDLGPAADRLERRMSQEVLETLEKEGLYAEDVANSEYLAAYCLYWWSAFVRGYRFELTILRDLKASGIAFSAHDLRKRLERTSPYDLAVVGQLGDIKHTTYFLHAARTRPLRCDFYITRLYDSRRRRYVSIVVMQDAAWRAVNGPVAEASLEEAADLLPDAVQVVFDEQRWVIVPYDTWKHKIRQKQAEERGDE
jgi:hypothetical protein